MLKDLFSSSARVQILSISVNLRRPGSGFANR